MNPIKAYRRKHNLTQVQLVEELNKILDKPIDAPTLSRMENGNIDAIVAVQRYCEKALASPFNEINSPELENIQSDLKELLKDRIAFAIYKACRDADINDRVTRKELRWITGTTDRNVRIYIEKLRAAGARIGATSTDTGYWLCKSEKDYEVFRKYYATPAWTTMRNVAAMDRYTEGQIEWPGQLT